MQITRLLTFNEVANEAKYRTQTTKEKLTETLQLNVNKTDFKFFSKPSLQAQTESIAIDINNEIIPNSKHILELI